MSVSLTYRQVSKHSTLDDGYIVIYDKIYNISNFYKDHPGGRDILAAFAGGDATEAFVDRGHSDEAWDLLATLQVGTLRRLPGDPKPQVAKLVEVETEKIDPEEPRVGPVRPANFIVLPLVIVLMLLLGWSLLQNG